MRIFVFFYRKQPTYNPQKTFGHKLKESFRRKESNSEVYNKNTKDIKYSSKERYPRSIQVFKQDTQKISVHPTQKPLGMMEYLIETYSNKNDLILDFCMGSGTTGLAAKNKERQFVGIEKDLNYFNIAIKRLGHT